MKKKNLLIMSMLTVLSINNTYAQDPFIGEIRIFAGNFAPKGWAFCNGQLLPISPNQALFSLLGNIYGGNGTTTFALPDLRGKISVGMSNTYILGQQGGSSTVPLTLNNLPTHSHSIPASTAAGTTSVPTNAVFANTGANDKEYTTASNTTMNATGNTGGNIPINTMQPYTTVSYIIALQGIYPSRN
jgi:microcystin-dependent protein